MFWEYIMPWLPWDMAKFSGGIMPWLPDDLDNICPPCDLCKFWPWLPWDMAKFWGGIMPWLPCEFLIRGARFGGMVCQR
jgi:hypothetical protein